MIRVFENVRIVDLTRVLSGPFSTAILADMGAEVIKIEHPSGISDISRGDASGEDNGVSINGESLYFMSLNRGKKSITLDLKKSEGMDIFKKLVKKSDVVIDNFRPGVMEKLGISYQDLKKINPKIIAASLSGFGKNSPHEKQAAFDIIAQAMGGIMSITGQPENEPTKVGVALGDTVTAIYTAFAVAAALFAREVYGIGQYIDVAMTDCIFSLLEWNLFKYLAEGVIAERIGSRHPQSYPFDVFKAADGYFVIGTVENIGFGRLCEAMGQPELLPSDKFSNDIRRGANAAELKSIIEKWAKNYTIEEVLKKLKIAKVAAAPVLNMKQIAESDHIKARQMLVDVDHPIAGKTRIPALPVKLSETPAKIKSPSPLLGQHTEEVLSDLLGFGSAEIIALKESQVI